MTTFNTKMKKSIVSNYDFDETNQHLTISVYSDFLARLKEILSNSKPIGKAFTNIARVYVFLYWLNMKKRNHVSKTDLAAMTYAKHKDSLTKAINILEEHKLLDKQLRSNTSKNRYYYTYKVSSIDYERKTYSVTSFEYDIPILTWCSLISVRNNNANIKLSSSYSPHIGGTDSQKQSDYELFQRIFLGWYDELEFGDEVISQGHFSEKDGRFYHPFNTMPKEDRLSSVKWDGDNLVEIWDAHSAFFIVLGYYLKYIVSYQSVEDRTTVTKEANEMLKLAISNQFYTSIMEYHNKCTQWFINREKSKVLVQKYINKTYTRLFNKKGKRTKFPDSVQLQYIDEFFQIKYPCIRNWLLHYSRHKEIKDVEVYGKKKRIIRNQVVSISNIHHDIMPYEFELISMGLCKDLYDSYRIKCITVHDAIYIKSSDTKTVTPEIIDSLLAKRLGLSPPKEATLRNRKLF